MRAEREVVKAKIAAASGKSSRSVHSDSHGWVGERRLEQTLLVARSSVNFNDDDDEERGSSGQGGVNFA